MRCCWRHPPSKTVEVAGALLHRCTFRFVNDGMEKGFIQSRANVLKSGLRICSILVLVGAVAVVAMLFMLDSNRWLSRDVSTPHYAQYGLLLGSALVAGFTLIWLNVSRFYNLIGPVGRETVACTLALLVMVVMCVSEGYYMAKIVGYDPETYWSPDPRYGGTQFSDSRVLLVVESAVVFSHLILTVRWYIITVVPLAGVLVYVVLAWGCGGPEIVQQTAVNCVMLACVSLGISVGKRKMEWYERLQYVVIIEEKMLRCASEYQLSQMSSTSAEDPSSPRREGSVAQSDSMATSTLTGPIFQNVLDGTGSTLQDIVELGQREHWLINQHDVMLGPDRLVGHGGFGAVVGGLFQGKLVAVKVARREGDAHNLTQPIANELRILRQLRHPNIVMFYGACVDGRLGNISLVLEFVHGLTLHDYITSEKWLQSENMLSEQYQIMLDLCCALRYLHSRSPMIVHGDLKDSNVMIEGGPRAKLLDFGLSRVVTHHARPLGGTMAWCAPEVVTKASKSPNSSADVFSFGRIMSFIATREQPFSGLSQQVVKRLGASGGLSWCPSPKQEDLLATHSFPIIQQCLSTDPGARPSVSRIFEVITAWPAQLGFTPTPRCALELEFQSSVTDFAEGVSAARRLVPPQRQRLPQTQKQRPTQQGHNIPTVQEVPDMPAAINYAFRSGAVTPRPMQHLMVLDMVQRWNFQMDQLPCCKYHAAINLAQEVVGDLRALACNFNFPPDDLMLQCPTCRVFDIKPEAGDPFACSMCGYFDSTPHNNAKADKNEKLKSHDSARSIIAL